MRVSGGGGILDELKIDETLGSSNFKCEGVGGGNLGVFEDTDTEHNHKNSTKNSDKTYNHLKEKASELGVSLEEVIEESLDATIH